MGEVTREAFVLGAMVEMTNESFLLREKDGEQRLSTELETGRGVTILPAFNAFWYPGFGLTSHIAEEVCVVGAK